MQYQINHMSFVSGVSVFIQGIHWQSWRTRGVLAAIVLAAVAIYFAISGEKAATETKKPALRAVEILNVSDFANSGSAASSASVNEAIVRAETGGKVATVVSPNTRVRTGDVIAQLENSAQRASLLQAEGALEAAQAGQAKTQGGLRDEQVSIREASFESAKANVVNALLAAYSSVSSSLTTADKMFSLITNNTAPSFGVTIKNTNYKYQLEQTRIELEVAIDRQSAKADNLTTSSDLATEMSLAEGEVRKARDFLQLLSTALAGAIPTDSVSAAQIATYRSETSASVTALTSALSSIATTRAALTTAQESLEEGVSYTQETDLASASASVKQAQGAYASALSAYNKTVMRALSPGVVTSCSVAPGDVITMGADVCRVVTAGSNAGASYALPLSAVKYTPSGAAVFIVENGTAKSIPVETGLVTASTVSVSGLLNSDRIIKDVRGLKDGDSVEIAQ